ncbi:DNA/RNA-binding protein Alba-like [Ostreococcus tauri]|uniref:DNA/RNA-binding protein Alba-like n=1 Tax=Ostreococcus tauri TaxID=70448 RepID=Q019H7_OSTTA|nr:DNA/RNA-binding protein Alba-like [Ostreococcus tauri]CAL53948.1 DNA/RNA-binding protein Alba-like [Ostreococcus tauri]|eukprot:XP_003079290.1 DNA/RNA-binding protein Alba-like [Ostreococcus tauri]
MKSPPRIPSATSLAARSRTSRAPTLVVSNSNARPFSYYLHEARAMLREHGSVKLEGVGAATQHALVVSEVLSQRGIGKVTAVRTGTLDSPRGASERGDEHAAKIEVTIHGLAM